MEVKNQTERKRKYQFPIPRETQQGYEDFLIVIWKKEETVRGNSF